MILRTFLAAAAAAFATAAAAADTFPSRAITLIVPWPAGGSTDTHLRKVSEIASRHHGQPIIIENRSGASGMLGPAGMARTAAPDGYTLSQLTVAAFRQPYIQKVDWDPLRDFTYNIGVSGYTFGVVVKADSPFKSFDDLIAYARANPGKMSYASTGTGPSPHLLVEDLASKAGVQLLALRNRRAARDGPEGSEGAARRVQEGHGRSRPPQGAADARPGLLVQVIGGVREVGRG